MDDWEDLQKQVSDVVYDGLDDNLRHIKDVIRRTVRAKAATVFQWMSDEIMQNRNEIPDVLAAFGYQWPHLSETEHEVENKLGNAVLFESYMDRKLNHYDSQAFFHGLPRKNDSEDLHSVLSRVDAASVLGTYMATDDEDEDDLRFLQQGRTALVDLTFRSIAEGFHLHVTMFPRLPANPTNAALALMISETAGDPMVFHKLVNHYNPERAFPLPAIFYYSAEVIPRAVSDALTYAGFQVRG